MHQVLKQISLEQKQTFLRTQIIDSGVDPQFFMIFMGTVKNEGQNINLQNWTMNQLKKVVQQFKQSLEIELKRQQGQHSKLTHIQAIVKNRNSHAVANRVMGSKLPKKQKVFYERDDLWDYQMVTQQQCKKTPRMFDFNFYPEVNIKGIEVKKSGGYFFGIGAKSYIEVILAPNFSSNPIARKSQDVDWLRTQLLSIFPGFYIPPLQETPVLQTDDKTIIAKRGKQISQFLNSLVHSNHLLNNKFTHMFLTESNEKSFQNFKYKNNTIKNYNNIKLVQNIQGHISSQISQRMQDIISNSQKYSKQINKILKSIEQNLTKLQNDYINITKHYANLSQDFNKMRQKYNTLSQKAKFYQSQDNTDFDKRTIAVFSHLKTVLSTLQVHSKKQTFFIKDFTQQIIKVMSNQWNQFDILANKHKKQLQSYLTLKLTLSKKKQQFFLDISKKQLEEREKNTNSIETTLAQKQQMYKKKHPNQNKLEEDRKLWQGYINKIHQESFKRLLNSHQKQLQRKLNKIYPIINTMLGQRTGVYSNFGKYMDEEVNKIQPYAMVQNV